MPKEIHYCEVCGVSSEVKNVYKIKAIDKYVCDKHGSQYKKFGEFKDTSSRNIFDANEVRIFKDYAEIDTYDKYGNIVSTFIIDKDDVPKLGKHKWRTVFKNDKPYLFTGNQYCDRLYFHRLIFPTDKQIDHISGNTLDNRKCNLREVSIQENMLNLVKKKNNTSGIRGVCFHKSKNVWKVDFSFKSHRFYFKGFKTFEEAVYLRYLCEITFLKDFRNTSNDESYNNAINNLSSLVKQNIKEYFDNIINTSKEGV